MKGRLGSFMLQALVSCAKSAAGDGACRVRCHPSAAGRPYRIVHNILRWCRVRTQGLPYTIDLVTYRPLGEGTATLAREWRTGRASKANASRPGR
jgi:hypothetical protein